MACDGVWSILLEAIATHMVPYSASALSPITRATHTPDALA
mgnify:CR=1 FL=1